MKLTDAEVYRLEHKVLLEIGFWAFSSEREAGDAAMYVAGVRDMAQAVVEALEEG